ncbi:hypothetical protein CEXT_725731 [Caerostris extrusa]|uniref:Uncharacterized protein n=1 Tax=Caerostris extrusa TaxID=172846 RepID=A0AAV4MIV1_CAEEX|nr:hypothetical protein CEXT_725731 [Caerostris extrusa]
MSDTHTGRGVRGHGLHVGVLFHGGAEQPPHPLPLRFGSFFHPFRGPCHISPEVASVWEEDAKGCHVWQVIAMFGWSRTTLPTPLPASVWLFPPISEAVPHFPPRLLLFGGGLPRLARTFCLWGL